MSEDDEPDADAALQAEKDKRGGVKKGKNGSKACNWWAGNPTTGHYCGKTAGYSADKTTGLFRCIDHGGDKEQLKRGRTGRARCPAAALLSGEHKSGQKHRCTAKYKGFEWTGFCCNQTCADAVAKALYQHEHEGVPYPAGFVPPPPPSAAGV